jgi:cytochrome c biogenesis protein CcmG, thiol:disulfide interchange protein DsbE
VSVGVYSYRHSQGSQPASATAKQHRPAPDFTLPLIDGGQLQLSSYRGKVVLLDFWATWCVPCREETPHFVALQQRYGGQGLQIIGVSMDDSPDPVHSFYQQFHMNYPVVMGTADVGAAYGGVLGLPIAFLIDREGQIYAKHMGATDAAVFEKDITTLLQSR